MLLKTVICCAAFAGCILSVCPTAIPSNDVTDPCFTTRTPDIPASHLFHTKKQPFVIGHRGNPRKFQENTLEGFQSLPQLNADGFEVDVFLTADFNFVCFHDENTLRLTGVDRKIHEMTRPEIEQLRYKTNIAYGTQSYSYDTQRRIVFLEEVLDWAKTTNLIAYIEMKPSNPVLATQNDIIRSIFTGQGVGTMVQNKGMLNQVVLSSFDPVKTYSARVLNGNMVVGTAYTKQFWDVSPAVFQHVKTSLIQLFPSAAPCLNPIPTTSNAFLTYLYTNGIMEKAMGASFVDIELSMFNNPLFGTSDTVTTFRTNYNANIFVGGYTAYSMEKDKAGIKEDEEIIKRMIRQGIRFFVTDDIEKMKKMAKKKPKKPKKNANDETEREQFKDENEVEKNY